MVSTPHPASAPAHHPQSSKPVSVLSGVTILGGITAYARFSSVPSLVGSLGIGSIMALSGMRIRDGMDYGLETATASSAALMYPTIRRAVKTKAPVPATIAILATASAAYYLRETIEVHAHKPAHLS
ncbi:hypothetical protein L202_00248 [Cryptococcus amylolentus CBS 6039]|uniref:Uncharacterized protein n=2 Tax=Cryptococcus amylolentus TaxID=104669 RepID=A0A1E3I6J8_9TREE|nr:hypothetical protein L202_00248 [Cryptococcus amylolentus CBS 6039]ODN84259.1 hypothetical protein L202_00248 [Cryptococcus amylolentus CBS 6039]ODO11897.1 hypothetical protein I350_00681 [Cryptococcus amylolentus CBS 6273]